MSIIYSLEKLFQSYFGRFESIYYPVYRIFRGFNHHIVTEQTEVVIEGYPRVGNSFAVAMLRNSQRRDLSIASHLHVSAQLFKAKRLQKPAILLIRDPLSAVSSFILRDTINAKIAFDYYINFYKYFISIKDCFLVVDFRDLTNNYNKIIESLNKKFSTNFDIPSNLEDIKTESLKEIDEHYRFVMGFDDVSLVSSSPSPEKENQKEELMEYLISNYEKGLADAERIYREIIN